MIDKTLALFEAVGYPDFKASKMSEGELLLEFTGDPLLAIRFLKSEIETLYKAYDWPVYKAPTMKSEYSAKTHYEI
jgi:hypothetical protein